MRCSSGSVSSETSMTGGWYVCIMDMGREDGAESSRGWNEGLEEERWWFSKVVVDALGGVTAAGCLAPGEDGAGEAPVDECARR